MVENIEQTGLTLLANIILTSEEVLSMKLNTPHDIYLNYAKHYKI